MQPTFFNLGWQEFAVLGCCGSFLVGLSLALVVAFLTSGGKDKDE